MRGRGRARCGLLALALAAACKAEQKGAAIPPADSASQHGAASVGSDSTAFPERATRALGELRAGVTTAQWLAAHPGDDFVAFAPGRVREAHSGWCARASRRHAGGFARDAYFYPPDLPPSLKLPTTATGRELVDQQCVLGAIRVETPQPDSAQGLVMADQTRQAISRAYGAPRPATNSRRRAIAHYRAGLALDRSSPAARAAWLAAWRLTAGVPPSTTHFFCVYD